MAENSKISWTDHTFNPWMGCTKVSPGCKFCYAERDMDHRYGKVKWGPQGLRLRTSAALWKTPVKWNKDVWVECENCHWRGSINDTLASLCPMCEEDTTVTRQRVFCASLADIFEYKEDQEGTMSAWRDELFTLIKDTPNLDWLLLTKRPENILRFMDKACYPETGCPIFGENDVWPQNVWIGTSVEDQKSADQRIEHLLRVPASVRFLSCEPLLGAVDLTRVLINGDRINVLQRASIFAPKIHWVITGGESGPSARPTHPDWVRTLRDQCQSFGVSFHHKQWGEWKAADTAQEGLDFIKASNGKMCQVPGEPLLLHRIGKHAAGRELDGREWNEFPKEA